MPSFFSQIKKDIFLWLINTLVFIFFTTVLIFKKGYSYSSMILAAFGVIYLLLAIFRFKQKLLIDRQDKVFIFSLLFYFFTFAFSALVHQDGFREIDNPSKILLLLPLFVLFRHYIIHLKTVLFGITLGSALTGLSAIYQKFYLSQDRAFTEQMSVIQSGNISMSLAMMSLVIAIYWGIKKEYKWLVFSLICSALGVIASGLSGSRGGWVGLPLILAIILFFAYKHLNKKLTLSISLLFAFAFSAIIFIPQTNVLNRIHIAHQEVVNYFEHNQKETSLGARFDMWQSALLGIAQKPILGWGKSGYVQLKKQQLEQGIITQNTYEFNDAHNQYLDTTVKRGVIGLFGLFLIILIPLSYFVRQFKQKSLELNIISLMAVIHIVSVCGYFTSQTFLAHNSGSIFYFFTLIVLYSLTRTFNPKTSSACE